MKRRVILTRVLRWFPWSVQRNLPSVSNATANDVSVQRLGQTRSILLTVRTRAWISLPVVNTGMSEGNSQYDA